MTRPMTPAELRVAFDSTGLRSQQLADLMGVSEQVLFRYLQPSRISSIPDERADVVRALLADFDAAADRLATSTEAPEVEYLRLYPDEKSFWKAIPELEGWPLRSQSLVLAEAQRRTGQRVAVVFS